MYVDLTFLFLIYCFATIALAVSVYALWTLKEIEEYFKEQTKRRIKDMQRNSYIKPKEQPKRQKGLWG